MQSRIGTWGGSSAVRLPKAAVEQLGLKEGELVTIDIQDRSLIIRPQKPHFELSDLVAEAKAHTPPPAEDDAPMGEEAL